MQTYGEKLTDEQEVLSYAADILIDIYAAESAVLRARRRPHRRARRRPSSTSPPRACSSTTPRSASRRRRESALAAMAEGDTLRTLLAALRRVLKVTPVNTVALRRALADAAVARGGYILELVVMRWSLQRTHVCSRSLVVAALACACTSGPAAAGRCGVPAEASSTARGARQDSFREDDGSPIPADKRDALLPLRYFPPDPSYTVPAALQLVGRAAGRRDADVHRHASASMQRVGVLEFTLQGPAAEPRRLRRGRHASRSTALFVPFADATTGKETYPAGRYLDIQPTTTGFYTIDFNQAYNPYCAYNTTYECPYPPPSNRLKVRDPRRRKGARRMSRALQAIVFDFDGVIANSEPLHLRAFQQALAEDGIELTAGRLLRALPGLRRRRGVRGAGAGPRHRR